MIQRKSLLAAVTKYRCTRHTAILGCSLPVVVEQSLDLRHYCRAASSTKTARTDAHGPTYDTYARYLTACGRYIAVMNA
jgi:hypothetical protein